MSDDLTLSVRLRADGKGLTGEFNATDKQMDKLISKFKTAGTAGERSGRGMQVFGRRTREAADSTVRLERNTNSLAKSLVSVKGIIATLGIGYLAGQMVMAIGQFEKFDATLETVTGSTAAAGAYFREIEQFAASTPYTLDQSVQGFIKLKTLGLDPSMEAMRSYGNTASAMGKDMMQMVEAVADATTGEFERLKEFGVRANVEGDRVKFTFQGVTTEVGNNAKAINDYLLGIGDAQFAGAMEKQMERLPGLFSNFEDSVASLWRELGNQGATDLLSDGVRTATSAVVWLKEEVHSGWSFDVLSTSAQLWIDTLTPGFALIKDGAEDVVELHNEFIKFVTFGQASNTTSWLKLMGNAILDMPVNLKTAATIMIAEGDKLRIGLVAHFEKIGVSLGYGIDVLGHEWTLFTLGMKETFFSALDVILQQFAEWLQHLGAVVPEIGPLKGFSATLTATAADMKGMANNAAEVQQAIAAEDEAFLGITQTMNATTAAIDNQAKASREAADVIIDAALKDRTATLAARDAKIELLQAERKKNAAAQAAQDAAVKEAEAAKKAAAANKETAKTAEYVAQIYKDTATSIRGAFSGAFRDIIDGQNTFADRMKDVFKNMLADMATMAIARPIMIPMVSGLGGMMGVSESAQAATIKELGGAGDISPEMTQMGELIGAGMVGYLAGGAMADAFNVANPGMAQNLSGLGSAIGMYAGGPMGAAIGGALGFAAGSLFNGQWQTTGSSLNLAYGGGVVSGYSSTNQHRDGGAFGSDSDRTLTASLGAELTNRLARGFEDFEYRLTQQLGLLNLGNLSALNGFTTSVTLDTSGLNNEQVQAAITNWANEVSLDMARAVLPGLDAFVRAGEEAGATLERLGTALDLMYGLGRTLDITIASLTAGSNAAAQFGIQIQYATQDIISTANALANTRDMETRLQLEQQLTDQVTARYQLEQQMLQQLQQGISAIASSISGLRGDIGNDISGILGGGPRSITAIGGDLASVLPGSAPSAALYQSLIAQLGSAEGSANTLLGDIVNNQSLAAATETALAELQVEYEAALGAAVQNAADQWEIGDNLQAMVNSAANAVNATYAPQLQSMQIQLSAINAEILTQQEQYAARLTTVSELQTSADAALTDYNAQMNDYLSLTGDQVDQLKSLREETLAYYNAMAQLDNAMRGAAANLGNTLDNLYLGSLSPGARLAELQGRFDSLSTSAASATGYDLVSISNDLNALVSPLLSEAQGLYASGAGYQDVYNNIVASLGDVQDRLLSEAPQGYEESTLSLLTSIDGLLGGMQDVLSAAEQAIIGAIDTSRLHTVGTLEDIRQLLGGEGRTLASFDTGTAYVPGDMTANIHQGEKIIDPRSSEILSRYGIQVSGGGNGETLAALNRIERLLSEQGGDLRLTVVTPDGKTIKEEVITDIKKRSKRGEQIVNAAGVYA